MRKLKFILDRTSLETIYTSFIRPLLEYADVVWDKLTKYEEQELENIQVEAARIVTGSTKLVSINALYIETGWETLKARRHKHKLVLYYKMKLKIAPSYLCSLIPPQIGQVTQYNLRNTNNIRTISCKSQLYYNSFLPSTVRAWNDLPTEIRNSESLNVFNQKLNATIKKPPKYYFTGQRTLQIYHTRLRTKCSGLNGHLFSKNIIEDPSCLCGSFEDTNHYLLHCPLYTDHRNKMMNDISNLIQEDITLDILIFGSTSANNATNSDIFKVVQSFISKSKRF